MSEYLQPLIIVSVNLLGALLPAILLLPFTENANTQRLSTFSVFFLLNIAVLFIPNLPVFDALNWNWQGKLLNLATVALFVAFYKPLNRENFLLSFRVDKSVWLPFVILSSLAVGYSVLHISDWSEVNTSREYLLFQLSMPGLAEESVFRGVLLGLLNSVFLARRRLLGISVGWAAALQCVLFALGHALYFDEAKNLQFHWEGFVHSGLLGMAMTYLALRGKSILPSILFHNLYNSAQPLVKLFL